MPLHRIMDIRNNSKSKDKDGKVFGPWLTHFEEMARKTPIRRLAKRLPLSPEFHKAAVLDEYVDAGTAPDFAGVVEANSEAMRLATEAKSADLDLKYAQSSEGAPVAASDSVNPPSGEPATIALVMAPPEAPTNARGESRTGQESSGTQATGEADRKPAVSFREAFRQPGHATRYRRDFRR